MIKIEYEDTPIEVAKKLVNATLTIEKTQVQKAIGKAFGNEDDFYHIMMFTENELEEIADHLYAVVKRVRKEQDNDSSVVDNSDMRSNQSNSEHCSDSGARMVEPQESEE